MIGKERYEARQQARCRKAYARGRAAAAYDAKRGGLKVALNPYGVTDPASVSWLAGYRGTAVNWRDVHVLRSDLVAGYQAMAEDENYECEATEWVEGLIGDIADEPTAA
jgi:hypothetical protein